jgi:topoisomerase-4 subunit A
VGKDIIHIAIFDKGDKRTTYNFYRDGKSGPSTKKDLMFLLPEINYMI